MLNLHLHFLLILFFASMSFGCKKEEGPAENAYLMETVQYKNLAETDPDLLSLDIYYPENVNGLKPVVVYVHGGAWAIGDKANAIENKRSFFAELNYVFVSINYRLSPANMDLAPGRIMYPDHNQDVADAVLWVYQNIDSFGGDKNKMALMGHSAGAHLVALTASSPAFLPARGLPLTIIKGVACIDTEGYDVVRMATAGSKAYLNAFGTDSTTWKEASPLFNLQEGTQYPKFFIAKRGKAERLAVADAFIEKLKALDVEVFQLDGSQYSHAEINKAIGAPGEKLISEPLKAFFSHCFN